MSYIGIQILANGWQEATLDLCMSMHSIVATTDYDCGHYGHRQLVQFLPAVYGHNLSHWKSEVAIGMYIEQGIRYFNMKQSRTEDTWIIYSHNKFPCAFFTIDLCKQLYYFLYWFEKNPSTHSKYHRHTCNLTWCDKLTRSLAPVWKVFISCAGLPMTSSPSANFWNCQSSYIVSECMCAYAWVLR